MGVKLIGHFQRISCHAVLLLPWAIRTTRRGKSSISWAHSLSDLPPVKNLECSSHIRIVCGCTAARDRIPSKSQSANALGC